MDTESKRKILFVITKSNFGGAQRYVFDLATSLSKKNYTPSVALGGSGLLKNKLVEFGIKTIPLENLERDLGLIKELKATANIYKAINDYGPEIVHLNSSKAGILGAIACRFYNLKILCLNIVKKNNLNRKPVLVIFTAHGWAFKEKRGSLIKKMIEYISWITILLCDTTIVVSQDDRERVKKFIFVQSKIKMIHNGIDIPTFLEKKDAIKIISEKMGRDFNNNLIIGTIAELHKNKGIEYAITAVNILKNQNSEKEQLTNQFVYLIIGEGEERRNLENKISECKLSNTVILAGEYPGAYKLLKAFDIFLIPSLKEGLPYALLEAGTAKLPIVATNVGGIKEVIEDMKSGIAIKEKRPQEIASALKFLIENENKRKEFGDLIYKKIENEYTLDQMISQTENTYY